MTVLTSSLLFSGLCIQKNPKKLVCPRKSDNIPSEKCVASFITKSSCINGGGSWVIVKTHFTEKYSRNSNKYAEKYEHGLAYEPHLITQGTEHDKQYLVAADLPEVIDAPSTVVNHNGMNLEGKFSSYKWKIPYFPSDTIQRCVLRIR